MHYKIYYSYTLLLKPHSKFTNFDVGNLLLSLFKALGFFIFGWVERNFLPCIDQNAYI